MRVEIRKGRNGKIRTNWYGVYEISGKKYCLNLGIAVKGTPPKSLRDTGDYVFERTHVQAQEKILNIVNEARSVKNSQYILEKLYEQKTGNSVPEVELCNLIEAWRNIPRRKSLSPKYVTTCSATLRRLIEFIHSHAPKITNLSGVNKNLIWEFLESEEARGISAKTYNDIVILLRTVWNKLLPGYPSPLANIPTKQVNTCFRKPFSEKQIRDILETASTDAFIYPIIVTGICTAMRRGDCCLLKWRDVDMRNGFISVKTAKTGAQVELPIWPLLKDILLKAYHSGVAASDYIFREQALMYLNNPDGITLRVKKLFIRTGVMQPGGIRSTNGKRIRRAPEYDFHSFRVTRVTIALSQGIPIEIVQRVTGHSTVSVVTSHYFRPNRETFKRVLENKLPDTLRIRSEQSPKPQLVG